MLKMNIYYYEGAITCMKMIKLSVTKGMFGERVYYLIIGFIPL